MVVATTRGGRWGGALALLEELRRDPEATRASAARRHGLSTGSATDISARLRELNLLAERPVAPTGRGRPTTGLEPHPDGPVVMAIDLRYEDVRYALADLAGRVQRVRATPRGPDPEAGVGEIREAIAQTRREYGHRLRVVSLAIAGTVLDGRVAHAALFGWGTLDLQRVLADPELPLLANNDATLAGLAEVRSGAAQGVGTALHLTVEVGVGGALLVAERAVSGAGGAAGEYGHLPFGDRSLLCPCGARGCWDLDVDGRALARHLGAPPPTDPRAYAREVIAAAQTDPRARDAVTRVVTALASGIAGLVNLHDPDVVTLGGLGKELRAAAPAEFSAAYEAGLMAFRRPTPPPVRAAVHGEEGALRGAAAAGLDLVLSEAGLDAWEHLRLQWT